MTAELERVETVAGQVPLPGMPDENDSARVQKCTQRAEPKQPRRAS